VSDYWIGYFIGLGTGAWFLLVFVIKTHRRKRS
jgi:hypothetical protein